MPTHTAMITARKIDDSWVSTYYLSRNLDGMLLITRRIVEHAPTEIEALAAGKVRLTLDVVPILQALGYSVDIVCRDGETEKRLRDAKG